MRPTSKLAIAISLVMLSGCRHAKYVAPESPMPANTILLSQMLREQPGFVDGLLKELQGNDGKRGPALLTPKLIDDLRTRMLGKDWAGLDRFPGWTMKEITPTVDAVSDVAGKNEKLEAASAAHPGAPVSSDQQRQFLDLGSFAIDDRGTITLQDRSDFSEFTTEGIVSKLGEDVIRGDGPNKLAQEHRDSLWLATVFNRLAANKLEHTAQTFVILPLGDAGYSESPTPEDLLQILQQAGHTITVTDSRYFANFAHLHYKQQDVMAPFWINSQMIVPNSGGRPLLIPVAHAEYEWHIHGPLLNADVSYYFGVDGKAEWRVMDTLDQAWVLKRDAHTYTGADAIEVTRLAGLMTAMYMRLHAAHPALPFGGYYALGVCQDGVSAIEQKMTGHVTLFPNTADLSLFNDPRDAEMNALFATIPKDRKGSLPEPERIFGSLPTTNFNDITIPGLADDLNATYAAWKRGDLERTHTFADAMRSVIFLGSAVVLGLFFAWRTHRYMNRQKNELIQRNPYK